MNRDILIGADPEVFVKKDGEFCSGHGLIEGTKEKPSPVPKGAVQVDGMALEFNIDPAKDCETFIDNINCVMAELQERVRGYEVVVEPVADFSEEVFKAQPYEATVLGCDPDFNGWTLDVNDPPDGSKTYRTAAGHIHVGYVDAQNINDAEAVQKAGALARQLDFYLGLPSLLFDASARRREMYGKAGAFRVKPYGMEYRVLSNKWLADDGLKEWVYRNTVEAFRKLESGVHLCEEFGDIQQIINTSDTDAALEIIELTGIKVA